MSVLASPEYVNAGSRVTYTGQFDNILLYATITDVIQGVGSYLLNSYNLTVEKADNNISITGSGSVTLSLRTNIDRGDGETDDGLTDILNNVNDAFNKWNCTPTASGLNQYVPAAQDGSNGSSGAVNTGTPLTTVTQQAAVAAAAATNPNNPSTSWWSSLTGGFSNTVSQIEAGSVGIVIGAVVVIGALVYLSIRE